MPAYNAKDYIEAAIKSVLNQDYPHLELIIVDDGSTDGSAEVASRFGNRVRVLKQANAGPAAARNLGVSEARGQLLTFIDADDIWESDKTSRQVAYLAGHLEVGIVFGRLIRWFANDDGSFGPMPKIAVEAQREGIVSEESGWIYPEMLLDSVIWIVSAMVRREVWAELGGLDESLRTGEDYDFFIRASRLCEIHELDRVVALYRIHMQSTTRVMRPENNEHRVLLRALKCYGRSAPDGRMASAEALGERIFNLCFAHGYLHYRRGSSYVAKNSFREALRQRSWRLKTWVYFGLSWIRCSVENLRNTGGSHGSR